MIDPRIRILYLILISVLVFVFDDINIIAGFLLLQVILWVVLRVKFKELRFLKKSALFLFSLLFFYAVFSPDKNIAALRIFGHTLMLSETGLALGAMMGIRLLTLLSASVIVRAKTKSKDFVKGLTGLGMPKDLSLVLESTLAHIRMKKDKKKGKKRIVMKKLLKGDLSFMIESINKRLADAKKKFKHSDVALLFAFTTLVVGVRLIRIAPGLPLAPGHKNLLLIPFFITAAILTKGRFTATKIGFLSGIINFMLGFGKFGVFGILQSIVPGLIVDLLLGLRKVMKPAVAYAIIGLLAGLGKVSALILLSILFGMPEAFYVVISPYMASQCIFGVLSAPITVYLLRNIKS